MRGPHSHGAVGLTHCMPHAGGYDHVCKVWDVRSKTATLSLDHGAPIEALTYFPSGADPARQCSRPRIQALQTLQAAIETHGAEINCE